MAWYTDCLLKARTKTRSGWLAFVDLDEWILPDGAAGEALAAASPASVMAETLYIRSEEVASLCLQRIAARATSPIRIPSDRTLLSRLGSRDIVDRNRWNGKCLHRIQDIETLFVHWPEQLRATGGRETIWLDRDVRAHTELLSGSPSDDLWVVHVRNPHLEQAPYAEPLQLDPRLINWQDRVAARREAVLRDLPRNLIHL